MQKTANQIKSSFETLASGHYQIHSFLYAQEFEQQAYENLIYPLMLVYPLGGSLSGTTYSRNYRVIIADRVLKSEGNELEVESDTQLIALDVLAYWMKLGQNERFTITSSNTINPFWEKWGDEVTGHFVDIGIEEFYDFNSCAIPLSGSIPTPVNPCKDARISVNSVVYGNAPSDSNFNVVVKDQDGDLVGSLIGSEWIVNTGGSCADATYTIEDSLGNVLYTGSIVSGGSLTQGIGNSTANLRDTNGLLISTTSILAEGSDDIVAPDGQVSINGAAFDSVVSNGTLDIDVYPSSGTTQIGSKQGTHYRIDDSVAVIKDSANNTLKTENILAEATENISISDSVAVIKDSANLTLKSENILAQATENIVINDSLVNVRKSDNVLISAVSVKAENTENYLVGDSNVTNSNSSYDVNIKATDSLILPDQQINVNSVDEGDIPSVGTIDIDISDGVNPVAPTSVTITGRTIDIVVPSGGLPTPTLLLDSYSGAGFAYSLRKLRAAYTGNCIRVRRSSDNTEQDIGFTDLIIDQKIIQQTLDTDALLSFVGSGNAFITIWYDQSTNGLNVAQSTASLQPQIVTSGLVNKLNGLPCINYSNSANKILISSSNYSVPSATSFSAVLQNLEATSQYRYVYSIGTTAISTAYHALIVRAGGTAEDWINGDALYLGNGFGTGRAPRLISNGGSFPSGVHYNTFGLMGTSGNAIYNNNVAISTRVNTSGNIPTQSGLVRIGNDSGGTFQFIGNIQEIILWGSYQDTNRANIQLNVNNFFNVF
jgi:hypothetical protein